MKRSLGGFFVIVGIILSTYAFSVYNLFTANIPASEIGSQPGPSLYYIFFALSLISVIAGVFMISTQEDDVTE